MDSEYKVIKYRFKFDNWTERDFLILLDKETLSLVKPVRDICPDWTRLKNNQCANCPFHEEEHPYCPVAVNLIEIIDFFGQSMSHEEVEVIIETDERTYYKKTALQFGVSSLIGIYMVTSGCPIMDKLRPMVSFHLPFATVVETTYRVMSMYLLAQYFLYKRGHEPDMDLHKLSQTYEGIRVVNEHFCKRLLSINIQDASLNALVNLDVFAYSVTSSINERMLDEIEILFRGYNL